MRKDVQDFYAVRINLGALPNSPDEPRVEFFRSYSSDSPTLWTKYVVLAKKYDQFDHAECMRKLIEVDFYSKNSDVKPAVLETIHLRLTNTVEELLCPPN